VLLRPGEIERLEKLNWGEDKPYTGKFYETFAGFPYFKRQADGSCVFQGDDGRCLMHKRFGFEIKALTCRGYPFNYVSTWPGEVSVLARMDCPAVLRNHGELLSKSRRQIEKLAGELRFGGGFTAAQLQGLERQSIEMICDSLRTTLQEAETPPGRLAAQLMLSVQKLEKLGFAFLNDRKTLREVLPSLVAKCQGQAAAAGGGSDLSAFSRAMFRQLLSAYCLRDEEMLDTGVHARVSKTWQLAKVIFGGGNLRAFAAEHPDFPLRQANVFCKTAPPSDAAAWESWRRFVAVRLECYQFFGFAYYQVNFFSGLKALLLTYPLALALARIAANSNKRQKIEAVDVEYAVAAIDHCHGRSPRLKFKFNRHNENYFAKERFIPLIENLGLQ
jgi:hypothetical protein